MSPFKTIWPDFCIVYPNDSFQTIWCILSQCTQVTAFKTIWPDFCTVYLVDSNLHKMHTFSWNLEISWKYAYFHLICRKLMKDQLGYTLNKSRYKVLKGVIWVHSIKSGHMVLKGVNWVHIDKIRSNGLERSKMGIQYKNQVIWSWKESIGYTMQKSGHMVLKGVNWVHNDKIRLNCLERSN